MTQQPAHASSVDIDMQCDCSTGPAPAYFWRTGDFGFRDDAWRSTPSRAPTTLACSHWMSPA